MFFRLLVLMNNLTLTELYARVTPGVRQEASDPVWRGTRLHVGEFTTLSHPHAEEKAVVMKMMMAETMGSGSSLTDRRGWQHVG
ncbi:Protein of unknown function [Gryllus bimaculatus]|nr:Protein of unknown function [Gryllus bimaculatus]